MSFYRNSKTFEINLPPRRGTISVNPQQGINLFTDFEIIFENWEDLH